jgi:hypothetical protein
MLYCYICKTTPQSINKIIAGLLGLLNDSFFLYLYECVYFSYPYASNTKACVANLFYVNPRNLEVEQNTNLGIVSAKLPLTRDAIFSAS